MTTVIACISSVQRIQVMNHWKRYENGSWVDGGMFYSMIESNSGTKSNNRTFTKSGTYRMG